MSSVIIMKKMPTMDPKFSKAVVGRIPRELSGMGSYIIELIKFSIK